MQEKYTQAQINRLFTRGNASVLERAANIGAQANTARLRRSQIAESAGDDFDRDEEKLAFGDNVDEAAELMDELFPLCADIIANLESYSHEAINTLRDHVDDILMDSAGGEAADESRQGRSIGTFKLIAEIIKNPKY